MPEISDGKIYKSREVMRYLHISRSTLYRLLASGELIGRKVGRTWRFATDDLDRYVRRDATKD